MLSALLASCGFAEEVGYRYLGRIQTTNPAFVKVEKLEGQPAFLLISQFAAFSSGKVAVIPNIAEAVSSKSFAHLETHVLSD